MFVLMMMAVAALPKDGINVPPVLLQSKPSGTEANWDALLFGVDEFYHLGTESPKERLRHFFHLLEYFFSAKEFDHIAFRHWVEIFRDELTDIEFLVETSTDFRHLSRQLTFTKRIFREMVEASDKLISYSKKKFRGMAFALEMVKLKVKVLNLYNSHGLLDHSIDNVADRVSQYSQELYALGEALDKVIGVPEGVLFTFDDYFMRVETTIKILGGQLSM
ncbi:hypothetical protein OXX69_005521 [Metschnikowia pulcherrima]